MSSDPGNHGIILEFSCLGIILELRCSFANCTSILEFLEEMKTYEDSSSALADYAHDIYFIGIFFINPGNILKSGYKKSCGKTFYPH